MILKQHCFGHMDLHSRMMMLQLTSSLWQQVGIHTLRLQTIPHDLV